MLIGELTALRHEIGSRSKFSPLVVTGMAGGTTSRVLPASLRGLGRLTC